MTTFRLNTKPSLSAPVGSAIMPVEVDVGAGVFELQKQTQANFFASPMGLGSTTANTGRFTTLEASGLITAGAGINFGDETLSAYEEGTFTLTPLGLGTAGSPTFTTNSGRYTRIGDRVFINIYFIFTSKGGMTGGLAFDGLPFVTAPNVGGVRNTFMAGVQCNNYDISGVSGAIGFGGYIANNTSRILMRVVTTTSGVAVLNVDNINDTFNFFASFSYEVA